jgi:hypothetical protein
VTRRQLLHMLTGAFSVSLAESVCITTKKKLAMRHVTSTEGRHVGVRQCAKPRSRLNVMAGITHRSTGFG